MLQYNFFLPSPKGISDLDLVDHVTKTIHKFSENVLEKTLNKTRKNFKRSTVGSFDAFHRALAIFCVLEFCN